MKNELRIVLTLAIGIFGLLSAFSSIDIVNKFPYLFTNFDIEYRLEIMTVFILGSLLSILSILAVKFSLDRVKKRLITRINSFWIC